MCGKKLKKNAKHHKAFTLVEVILVVGMMAVVAGVLVGLIQNSYEDFRLGSNRSTLLQDGQAAIELMVRILRQAKGFSIVSQSTDQAGNITFTNVDGTVEQFRLNTETSELEYGEPNSLSALTGSVDSLVFTCYDINGNVLAGSVSVDSIQSVQIEATFSGGNDSFALSGRAFCPTDFSCFVGWWRLDEDSGLTAADSSGAGNDGTLTNMAGNEWTTGILDGALELDGYNDYVQTTNNESKTGTDFTWACWFKTNTTIGIHHLVWEGKTTENGYGGSASNTHEAHINIGAPYVNNLLGCFYGTDEYGTAPDVIRIETSFSDTTSWHHVAFVVTNADSSPSGELFLDGVSVGTDTGNQTGRTDWNTDLRIGRPGANERYFDGIIDDVRVYNCALSPTEVARLANFLRYRGFTEAKVNSDDTSITISTPAASEGDLLIAAVATDGDTSFSLAPPGGEGWTEIDIDDYIGEVTLGAWWKLAGASESSNHEFTWSGNQQAYGWMMWFTGHDPDDPINDYLASGESSSTPTSPAVTTIVDNCLVLRLGAFDDDDITVDVPGLGGHTAITMDKSSSSGSGGTVTILGSWTSGLTHTAQSGSNRALMFIAHAEDDAAIGLSSVTYGGQPMTKIIEKAVSSGSPAAYYAYVVAYILDEAGISAATGSTFAPVWSGMPYDTGYASAFLSNVSQTTPVGATASNSTTASTPNPITTSALPTANGDMVIDAATCGNAGDYIVNNGFTEALEHNMYSSAGVDGYISATGADVISSVTHSGPNRQVIISLVVRGGGGAGGTVSGGAGYVRQSAAGDSGTSTFALGSSNEAQTLTIAIAPAP